jgi:hypothetical protein
MNKITDFPSHLKLQRLTEELDAAQKKLKAYEDLCRFHRFRSMCTGRLTNLGYSLISRSIIPRCL